jgi:hypothetical protein
MFKRRGLGRVSVIHLMLVVSELYGQPYRQTEGLLRNILHFSGFGHLRVPKYNILTSRGKKLDSSGVLDKIKHLKLLGEEINIVMDATGIKILGENEWKVRVHGKGKRGDVSKCVYNCPKLKNRK